MTPDTQTKDLPPADQQAAQKVVLGCSKLLFDKATFPFLKQGLTKDMPMPEKLATETVGVMKLFASRVTNGVIPRRILLPAAAMLVLEIARFAARSGLGKPTAADIKAAVDLLPKLLMGVFPPGSVNGNAPKQAAAPAAPAAPAGGLMGGQ